MDRAALDAFFAQAEDVLDNWHGSSDSMNSNPAPLVYEGSRLLVEPLAMPFDTRLYDTDYDWMRARLMRELMSAPILPSPSRLIISSVF